MKHGKIALSACLAVALASSWGNFGGVGQDIVSASVVAAREAPASSWDEFIGFWEEDLKGEARFTVTPGDGAWYGIEASWPHGANQVEFWTMSAYPAEEHVLRYTDCIHYLLTFNGTVVEREEILYENGSGTVVMEGPKRLRWFDDQDHKADDVLYVPLRSPLGGGL